MNDLQIRATLPDDLDAVLAFWKTAAEGRSISDDREGVERLVARDAEALILAELVGTVIAGFDGSPTTMALVQATSLRSPGEVARS